MPGAVQGGSRGWCRGPGDPRGLSRIVQVRGVKTEPVGESVAVLVVAGVLVAAVELVLVAEIGVVVVRVVVLLEHSLVA